MKRILRSNWIGLLLIFLGIMIFIVKPINGSNNDKGLFYISGFGASLSQLPGEKETVSYSIEMYNSSNKIHTIQGIEPIIPNEIKHLIVKDNLMIKARKTLGINKEIKFNGEIVINTSKLKEKEISELLPKLSSFRIVYDQDKEVVLNTGLK
jgi:hypothetical protein